ncbi:hypothetical protein TELCIR_00205 [Teladorsagia circumcincta]|uniref:Uncharacterized protein n=1 Tax=Teladorsagia circumcincta TaxID=45464 RepID=A0A2G9V549_TELCI|nr:hypothetical protein TELCIR_00205 [Teladorsagia circumcincta]
MFEDVQRSISRKRPLIQEFASEIPQKENWEYKPVEKKVRQSQKVCLRCLAGEAGHITHVLSEVAA